MKYIFLISLLLSSLFANDFKSFNYKQNLECETFKDILFVADTGEKST